MASETRREALGRFLRARREALQPERAGIAPHRGRRTPGLRREEVAFLADIGVKWYARLEAGDEVHPSETTLTGIAVALQLSDAEFEYVLELAGLRQPVSSTLDLQSVMPPQFHTLVNSLHGVAAIVADRIATPLLWNELADAMLGFSRFENPVQRNVLVLSLFDPVSIAFLGDEREEFVQRAVGMLRLNESCAKPSLFAAEVFELVKNDPLFHRAWNRRVVAADLMYGGGRAMHRNHAIVGRLAMNTIDLATNLRSDLLLRLNVPADQETAAKFAELERLGRLQAGPTERSLRLLPTARA